MPVQYPLIVSTLCQRLGLGIYVISLTAVYLWGLNLDLPNIAAVSLVIFGTGLLASVTHLGKPQRMMNSFANPKSHLTQEGILSPFACLFIFIQAIEGRFFTLDSSLLIAVQVLAFLSSVTFIGITGLVYQLYARPAWKTRLVSINFFLSFITLGAVGTYVIAIFNNETRLDELLYLITASTILLIAGQIYYSVYVSRLGYGVAINVFDKQYATPYTGWLITGVIAPIVLIAVIFYKGGDANLAITLLLTSILSLIFWRAFFFLSSKIIKFFPQYESDMTTDY